mgnify:CR=1 FL=1
MAQSVSYQFKASDVYDFAASIGAETRQKGCELFFRHCPRCHGDGHDEKTFSVNLETGAFKCFRASCDYHGHFVELARDFDFRLDFGEAKTYRRLPQRPIEVKPSAIQYLESRGISREITERYKITACKDKPDILAFPFIDETGTMQFVKDAPHPGSVD